MLTDQKPLHKFVDPELDSDHGHDRKQARSERPACMGGRVCMYVCMYACMYVYVRDG